MKLEKSGSTDRHPTAGISHSMLQQLTPSRIADMTHAELSEVMPNLVSAVQQVVLSRRRPDWWPHNVPWTQLYSGDTYKSTQTNSLRRMVHQCYSYLSQCVMQSVPVAQPRVIDWLNSNPPSRSCTQSAKAGFGTSIPKHKGNGVPYLDIYLCYPCGEEFSSKDSLQKHQVRCEGTLPLSLPSTPPETDNPSPGTLTLMSDDASSSEGTSVTTSLSSSGVRYQDFVSALDLVPVFRAKKIRQAQRRNTECETIDLEEPQTPISPSTPRTPKLLISQLSRDAYNSGGAGGEGNLSRRRLSYMRQSSEKKVEKEGKTADAEMGSECESDAESCSTSSEETEDPKMHKKSLLSIDLTSGLGQRVIKHVTSELHVPVISDAEQFCRTPIKDKYQDRLRVRQLSYPITYKLTHKRLRQQLTCHMYKFTREDKREFMEKMRTGLNKQCRPLLRQVKKCSVIVKRLSRKTLIKWKPSLNRISVSLKSLTPEEIFYWTRPKPPSPIDALPSVFPTGPTLLLTDIDRVLGLKRKEGKPQGSRKLLAGNFVSEAANAELQLQKLTVYRSLLTDLSTSALTGCGNAPDSTQQEYQSTCVTRKPDKVSRYGEKFPSLFSILSGGVSVSPKKMSRGQPHVNPSDKLHDFKQPLKIQIPPPTVVRGTIVGNSSDDAISVKTTNSSSDEECNKDSVCCAMCAVRSKCTCSPEKVSCVSSQSRCSLQLPEQSVLSPKHTPPLPNMFCVGSSSLSPHPTLSPPVLSPVSQVSGSVSPGRSQRLTRASTNQSPVPSPLSYCGSSSAFPSPSSYSSRSGVPESPTPCPKRPVHSTSAASPRDNIQKGKTVTMLKAHGEGEGSLRPPTTRLTRRENLSDTLVLVQQKRSSNACNSLHHAGDAKPVTKFHNHTFAQGTEIRSTRSGKVIGETSSEASAISDISFSKRSQKGAVTRCRSGSRSSERSCDMNENDVDRVNAAEGGRKLRSTTSVSSPSLNSDKVLCVAHMPARAEKDKVSSASSIALNLGMSASAGSASDDGNRLGTRTSSRSQLVHISSKDSHALAGARKETSPCETGSQPWPSDTGRNSEVSIVIPTQKSMDLSNHAADGLQSANPFLLSKAQTALFSSSIREQARRRWHVSHKSPEHGFDSKAVLRSGNSFRTASSLSPVSALKMDSGSWQTGSVSLESTFSASGLPSPKFGDKVRGLITSTSPCIQQLSPASDQPTSPARKRLSPLQMLSVLESAKSKRTCGGKRKTASKHNPEHSLPNGRNSRSAYQTRAKNFSNAAKKMRLSLKVD